MRKAELQLWKLPCNLFSLSRSEGHVLNGLLGTAESNAFALEARRRPLHMHERRVGNRVINDAGLHIRVDPITRLTPGGALFDVTGGGLHKRHACRCALASTRGV
ncbi:MAG TPA: hypothetical protein VLP43_11605 [Solirubrobacteraceae bacterium]|nr:hypothetical protein [Solirubrobacteraceae bacterium]